MAQKSDGNRIGENKQPRLLRKERGCPQPNDGHSSTRAQHAVVVTAACSSSTVDKILLPSMFDRFIMRGP